MNPAFSTACDSKTAWPAAWGAVMALLAGRSALRLYS